MKKSIFLLTMACAFFSNSWTANSNAHEGRLTINLSDQGWRLWIDKTASWQNDHLFPPSEIVDVSLLPVNIPSRGWQMLNT